MLRASVGRGLEFGAVCEVAWQSRTVNGGQAVPDPTGHSENKELTGRPSKREEIKLFFSCNCCHNCLSAQLHAAILCCLEFPSQLRVTSATKGEQVRQLELPPQGTSVLKEAVPPLLSCSLILGGRVLHTLHTLRRLCPWHLRVI